MADGPDDAEGQQAAPPSESGEAEVDERQVRRQRRLLIALVVALVVIGMAAGVVSGLLHGHGHTRQHGSTAGVAVALAAPAAALLILVPWLVWLTRRPAYRRVMQYDRGRRMRVGKALRKGRPLTADDLPVAVALVATLRQQWWVPWMFAALGLFWLAEGLVAVIGGTVGRDPAMRWFALVLSVLYLTVLLPLIVVQRRRTLRNYDRLVSRADAGPRGER